MDHIQIPQGGLEHIEVPFVADLQFDAQDFDTFPERMGFPPSEDHDAWCQVEAGRLASLVQAWLYFGLIASFLDHPVSQDQGRFLVVRGVSTGQGLNKQTTYTTVSSAPLISLLEDWATATAKIPQYDYEREMHPLKMAVQARLRFEQLPQATTAPLSVVLLSITLLMTTLCNTLWEESSKARGHLNGTRVYSGLRPHLQNPGPGRSRDPAPVADPVAEFLTRELLVQGWCPFKVRRIFSSFRYSYATIYYLSRLRHPLDPSVSHAACTVDQCIGNNVDMTHYQTQHRSPSCTCASVSVPVEKMRSIIAAGGIPVVRVRLGKHGQEVSLEVKAATSRTPYIAISHVWSDGMGNPHANALPTCLLRRLHRSIRHVGPPSPKEARMAISIPELPLLVDMLHMALTWTSYEWFWLDTLCIPVGDAFVSLKSQAINQMAAIYAGAQQVLILDRCMQEFSVEGKDACHVLAQISTMAWRGRCWTYQEGALADVLQIRCADCTFDLAHFDDDFSTAADTLYPTLSGTIQGGLRRRLRLVSSVLWQSLCRACAAEKQVRRCSPGLLVLGDFICAELQKNILDEPYLKRGQYVLSRDERTIRDFVVGWNALTHRSTTMRADIHIILANFLRFNAFSILALLSPAARMQALLWSLPGIPLALFFNPSPDRVRPSEQHGNRWMPLWPGLDTLDTEYPVLDFAEGCLVLATAKRTAAQEVYTACEMPSLLLLDELLPALHGPTELVVQEKDAWFYVCLHRQPDDFFDSKDFQTTAFVLHEKEKAACFHVAEITQAVPQGDESLSGPSVDADPSFQVVFDCPSTASCLGPSLPSSYDTLPRFSGKLLTNYVLRIQHGRLSFYPVVSGTAHLTQADVPVSQKPLPQRQNSLDVADFSFFLVNCASPLNLLIIPLLILMIYELVRQGHHFSTAAHAMAYLIIIIHGHYIIQIGFLLSGLNFIPFTFGILYVALKSHDMGSYTAMDMAIVGLLISIHVPQFVVNSLCRWYVNPRLFKAWMKTYSPEWSPGTGDAWDKIVASNIGEEVKQVISFFVDCCLEEKLIWLTRELKDSYKE